MKVSEYIEAFFNAPLIRFSCEEMTAILKTAKMMAFADGQKTSDEKELIQNYLRHFGITIDALQSQTLELFTNQMAGAGAITILSKMSIEQKKYVSGYLIAVLVPEGQVNQRVFELWSLVSMLADFPILSVNDAVDFWLINHSSVWYECES